MSEKGLLKSLGSEKEEKDPVTLSELFDHAFELFNSINKTQEPTNSPKVQSDIRRTMNMFEDATRLVSMVDMFSDNESFEEVSTENVKYFLLPALLGTLTTKICGNDDRMHIVKVAETYFVDFLKRVKVYGLTDVEIPEINSTDGKDDTGDNQSKSNKETITEMVCRRNTKLQRYKEQKDLESRLDILKKNLDNPNIDDESKREYFVTLLKLYVIQTIEELNSLAAEKTILEHMKRMGRPHNLPSQMSQKQKPPTPKLQPIIITRDELQKQVYGAGYPSLPVLTVQEFYEQRVKDGDWPDPSQRNQMNSRCLQDMASSDKSSNEQEDTEAAEKEEKIERDDSDFLAQARAMDDYKDTHRRGWGNRANRS
ncbi:immunoglobulin-binding protein 1b [Harpegnathos saltator]|uniref:Immunoglobulin-binding protein 1b n=1 Tax=Harpegnathos saltator TaxID=610380 RepID=E2BYW2_HARSA|nr:immunoglobulin-binding protein 1b [Harpegnathos saltator]EFN79134.1 Immunoglobulin-binding protein 1b [Harpegnathos saltator]